MNSDFEKKRYMKIAQSSGCIIADYSSARENENSILAVNNSTESGVFYTSNDNPANKLNDYQCHLSTN